ncbi:MAG: hypothetical protein K2Z80_14865 [Xanthobacteraceae bacterium]|nr:hypothetical protein [Xanthobacteraceae bacterium]
MRATTRLVPSALCALTFLLTTAPAAYAKPNSMTNCTTSQLKAFLKTKDGKKCISQKEQDLINGSKTSHDAYCSSSGTFLCCQYDENNKRVDHTCETVKEVRVPFAPRATTNKPISSSPTAEKGGGGMPQPGLLDERGGGVGPRGPAPTGVAPTTPAAPPPLKLN